MYTEKPLTPEEALQMMKEGHEVMVKPYNGDDEILEYLEEKTEIEYWP